ncbi:MAG: class I SAM-dependent methyltransferase [Bacteroidota bacterium]
MVYPEVFARFYDIIYSHLRDGTDNRFYLDRIRNCKGKALEIGVGTGRFFMDALESGSDVYGIDISPSMVEVLKSKMKSGQHRVSIQNATDFGFPFTFRLVIAPFRVFMHLTEMDVQLQTLNNIYRHLDTGGEFIFDAFVPDLNYLLKGFDNHIDFEGEYQPGKKLRRRVSTIPDLISQIITVRFSMDWEDESGKMQTEDWTTDLRFFFRYELEHLISRSMFRNFEILGNFDGSPLQKDSREFIVVCRK